MASSIAKFVFILVLAKIDLLDSRAVEIVYSGHGCDCPKSLPYQVNVPVQRDPENYEIRSYGYKVDAPAPARAKYSYSFDFVVEEPVPPPQKKVQKEVLYAVVDKVVLPKPDCMPETVSSCAAPEPSPEPEPKPCQYSRTKICTCGRCSPQQDDYAAPAYSRSCTCGKCDPTNPQCGYVLSNFPSNRVLRSGRSRRDVSPKKHKWLKFLQTYNKPLKATRDATKSKSKSKSKLVKRDIKGEYDLLKKDHAALDMTIPEIIQYMPETLMPGFKRGKCNIGCKNCMSKHLQDQETNPSPDAADSDTVARLHAAEEPMKGAHKRPTTAYSQHFLRPQFADASYLKRSVDPYQYQCPCCPPALMPPSYMPSPAHLSAYAQNTGYPNWYQPRPLIDPHGHYVFDRLGHKYEVGNEGLKLMTPTSVYESNRSAPASGEQTEKSASPPAAEDESEPPTDGSSLSDEPTVGAPRPLDPTFDPHMEKVIRDIIYKHPDFIDATERNPRSPTHPQGVQNDETMQFLGKLVRGRLNSWFGADENESGSNLQDLNRHSRQTGTSIRFIPVVTVDKEKLNRYRLGQAQLAPSIGTLG